MTVYGLADKTGLAHSTAECIACDMRPFVRPNPKTGQLSHYDEGRLRRAFLHARLAPRPAITASELPGLEEGAVNEVKPEGYALSLIVQKTGIAEGTIKSLLSRHAELQEPPYSAKAAGVRVFFDPFVEWLAAHQGKEVAKVARNATSATRLPSGAQLHELRLMAEKDKISKADLRELLGLAPVATLAIRESEGKAPLEIAEPAFGQLHLIAEGGKAGDAP